MDLHQHWTMDVALKPFFRGSVLEKPQASDYSSRLKSRIDGEALEKSGLRVVGVALYINPFWGEPLSQLESQINILQAFTKKFPQWHWVETPAQAREVLERGEKVFFTTWENSSSLEFFPDPELTLKKAKIVAITLQHFTDYKKKIGSNPPQKGLWTLLEFIFNFIWPNHPQGLKPLGQDWMKRILSKSYWLDLSHMSPEAIDQFLQDYPEDYPWLWSHGPLAKDYGTTRGLSSHHLELLSKREGVFGLIASDQMLGTSASPCGGESLFLERWKVLEEKFKKTPVLLTLGSDMNAPLQTMSPSQCGGLLLHEGLVTAQHLEPLIKLQQEDSLSRFLKLWSRLGLHKEN